jgi:hypothetical protein
MDPSTLSFIEEAIRAALVEIEQCSDISQGVEDDLHMALLALKGRDYDGEEAT